MIVTSWPYMYKVPKTSKSLYNLIVSTQILHKLNWVLDIDHLIIKWDIIEFPTKLKTYLRFFGFWTQYEL